MRQVWHLARLEAVGEIERGVRRPKAHYSLVITNHDTGARLKVELIDLPFLNARRYRLRVN